MELVKKKFEKVAEHKYKCKIIAKKRQNDEEEEADETCGEIVTCGKESLWNLKRHIIRQHEHVMKEIETAEQGFFLQIVHFIKLSI